MLIHLIFTDLLLPAYIPVIKENKTLSTQFNAVRILNDVLYLELIFILSLSCVLILIGVLYSQSVQQDYKTFLL